MALARLQRDGAAERPASLAAQGHAVCGTRFPEQVYHWHREGFDLPKDAILLAEGDDFEVQACRYGRSAYAVQFHPEVSFAIMCRWTLLTRERLAEPGPDPAIAIAISKDGSGTTAP